jgi:hypothetical protein
MSSVSSSGLAWCGSAPGRRSSTGPGARCPLRQSGQHGEQAHAFPSGGTPGGCAARAPGRVASAAAPRRPPLADQAGEPAAEDSASVPGCGAACHRPLMDSLAPALLWSCTGARPGPPRRSHEDVGRVAGGASRARRRPPPPHVRFHPRRPGASHPRGSRGRRRDLPEASRLPSRQACRCRPAACSLRHPVGVAPRGPHAQDLRTRGFRHHRQHPAPPPRHPRRHSA